MASSKLTRTKKRPSEPLRLVFDTDAHRAMDEHCSAAPRNEVCGILVGFTGEDASGRWTRVVSIIRGVHAREDQMSVTFTHETWDAVHAELAKRDDKARVIGWYHSHPDFGIFYSAPDRFVHRNFFGLEGQVGVVVDPVRQERGVFANTNRGLITLARYEVARQNKQGHLVDCKYVDEPLRDAMPEARAAAEQGGGSGDFARSSLDSIEANLARIERQQEVMFKIMCVGLPVLLLLAALAGMFIGRRGAALEIPQSALDPSRSPMIIQVVAPPKEPVKTEAAKPKLPEATEQKAAEQKATQQKDGGKQ